MLQKLFVQLNIQKLEIIILMIKLWPESDQLDMEDQQDKLEK